MGKYKLEMGLKLRQAMLINGVLYNSEAWHNLNKDDIKPLERVDECLLRSLLQNHPKAPIEFLYMETGSIPISHIISSRRMLYLRKILSREDEELTKRIYREQERNPSPGDFVELVKDDFSRCNLTFNEELIIGGKEGDYKRLIRKHIKMAALNELKTKQSSHSKVNNIVYENLEKQPYLISPIFTNDDIGILSNLRSHTTRGIRANFKQMYKDDQNCPLKCNPPDTTPARDTQEHLLFCTKLKPDNHTVVSHKIVIDNIYGTVGEQKAVMTLIKDKLEQRNKLLDEMERRNANRTKRN